MSFLSTINRAWLHNPIPQDISFSASDHPEGHVITVDKALVQTRVNDLLVESDVSKYIL